jgi:hypothetical protein
MTLHRTALFSLFAVACLVACASRGPVARDASGRPVFDKTLVRHPPNKPYFCFKQITGDGVPVSPCFVIREFCVDQLHRTPEARLRGGCEEAESVSCYGSYSVGTIVSGSKSFCWATPTDCDRMSTGVRQHDGNQEVSSCAQLDRSFGPASG